MHLQSYKTKPNLSSENSFLTKILDYQDSNSLKKLLKTPNLSEDNIKEILADYFPTNLDFLLDKFLQIQSDLENYIDFEFNQSVKDLCEAIYQTSQITNQLLFQNQINIF